MKEKTTDKTITSAANPAVKRLRGLDQKKNRDEEGVFMVEGARHVNEALRAGWELETLAYSPRAGHDPAIAAAGKAHRLEVTDDLLSRITGRDNTQPLIGVFRQRWMPLSGVKEGLWIALEGIRDPGNLGTISRSADAVKAEGIILVGQTCDAFSPEAIRATMGSFSRVKLVKASLPDMQKWRADWKGRVTGTHLDTKTDYRKGDYALPLLLVMGSEQAGLSPEMAKLCDTLVKIPMPGGAESLNLAVSTGIMLYEICRNRI
jgi:RNA methyltransferase, TrmH family